MNAKQMLKKLYEALGTWDAVATELGISYTYIYMMRKGRKPGAFLLHVMEEKTKKAIKDLESYNARER